MEKDTLLEKALESGINKGYVDVVMIANELGIGVFSTHGADDFNAKIVYDEEQEKFKLYVNENHMIERQRFSVAHELAHYALHEEKIKKEGGLNRDGTSAEEEEADHLAAEMLMPEKLVKEYILSEGVDPDDDDLKTMDEKIVVNIANKFRVSKSMAIVRLRELNYYVPFIQFS